MTCFDNVPVIVSSWNFQELLPLTEVMSMQKIKVKDQGHRAQSKFCPLFGCFQTITPVWVHRWLLNVTQSLKWFRRAAILFFKVIHQISRSQRPKNRFWPELSISGLYLQFEFTDDYEIMHKAWRGIEEVPYCFSRSFVKFKGHTGKKKVDLALIWVFLDDNSNLNSQMAIKLHT